MNTLGRLLLPPGVAAQWVIRKYSNSFMLISLHVSKEVIQYISPVFATTTDEIPQNTFQLKDPINLREKNITNGEPD